MPPVNVAPTSQTPFSLYHQLPFLKSFFPTLILLRSSIFCSFFQDYVRFRVAWKSQSIEELARKQFYKESPSTFPTPDAWQEHTAYGEPVLMDMSYKIHFNLPHGCLFPAVYGIDFSRKFVYEMVDESFSQRDRAHFYCHLPTENIEVARAEAAYVQCFELWWYAASNDGGMDTRSGNAVVKAMRESTKPSNQEKLARHLLEGKHVLPFKLLNTKFVARYLPCMRAVVVN